MVEATSIETSPACHIGTPLNSWFKMVEAEFWVVPKSKIPGLGHVWSGLSLWLPSWNH